MTKFIYTILYDFIYTNMTLIYEYENLFSLTILIWSQKNQQLEVSVKFVKLLK